MQTSMRRHGSEAQETFPDCPGRSTGCSFMPCERIRYLVTARQSAGTPESRIQNIAEQPGSMASTSPNR